MEDPPLFQQVLFASDTFYYDLVMRYMHENDDYDPIRNENTLSVIHNVPVAKWWDILSKTLAIPQHNDTMTLLDIEYPSSLTYI
jgi:hypothetical protein